MLGLQLERPAISKIETGYREVTDKEVLALAKALGVSAVWLLGETNKPISSHQPPNLLTASHMPPGRVQVDDVTQREVTGLTWAKQVSSLLFSRSLSQMVGPRPGIESYRVVGSKAE